METKSLDFLKRLMALPTPSGWESDGMRLAADYLAPTADRLEFDLHGNLHAVLNPDAATRVMIEGHCDEIGLMVQYVDDDGYLYMTAIGGLTVPLLAGERIVIQGRNGPVYGVFGVRPPHLMKPADREKVAPAELMDIAVDIGAASKKRRSSWSTWATPPSWMPAGGRWRATASPAAGSTTASARLS